MLPVCYPSSPSPTTGLPEAVAYALSSVSGLTRWVDYIPVKLVGSPLGMNEQTTNLNGFVPMRLLGSAIGMNAWRDYIPVYVDNSATEAWVTSATGYIPYANSVSGVTTPSVPSFYFNFSNPSNVTLGSAQARGTITSTQNAVIAASVSPSRTTGVAPLYVNFDATATTSTLITDADPVIQTARRNHELFYATDFGDTGAGTWANGVQSSGLTSKNAGYGPVTGHVYETPGTYTVQMVVTDGVNTAVKTGTIVVQDPNTVYAGTDTICLSHSGNYTGAPAGSYQPVITGNTDMYSLFNTYAASNKRILFCKADSWTVTAEIGITSLTNLFIGGYGTGVARAFGAGTLVNVDATAVTSNVFATYTGCSDIRICEMKVLGTGRVESGVYLINGISQFTSYKLEFRGVASGFTAYPGGGGTNNQFDQHCLYECVTDDIYGYAGVDKPTASAAGAAGPGVFTSTSHPFRVNFRVQLTGTPPAPLQLATDYYICQTSLAANTFTLSATQGGAALALSGSSTCTVTAQSYGGGVSAFVGITRGGIMGCSFDNRNRGEQTIRLPFLDRAHVNNNYIARPNQGKNILKIHSFIYTQVPLYTEKFVVQGNVLDMRGGYSYNTVLDGATITTVGDSSIIMSNGGASGYEKVRNAIVENNFTYGCLGNPKDATGSNFAFVGGPNITLRNNIADFSVGDRTTAYSGADIYTSLNFATVTSSTDDPTTMVRIYNNTLYSNLANGFVSSFVVVNQPTNVTATGAIGPGVFTSTASHYMVAGQKVRLASGTPPAPLSLGVDYWVTPTSLGATTFTLAATNGGAALALSGTGTCVVYRSAEVDSLTVKNNIWYLPHHNVANPNGSTFNGGFPPAVPTSVTADHNTSNNGNATTSPNFVATPPVALTDWRPTAAWTIDNGATVPVLRDFNLASRVGGTYDLGAVLP